MNTTSGNRKRAQAGRTDGAGGIPGTNALRDPWQGIKNGKGLTEDAADNVTKMVLNQDFTSGLTQPSPLLDHFPYVPPPPES